MTDLKSDLQFARGLADAADALSMARFRAGDLVVTSKPDHSPVSDADKSVMDAWATYGANKLPLLYSGGNPTSAGRTAVPAALAYMDQDGNGFHLLFFLRQQLADCCMHGFGFCFVVRACAAIGIRRAPSSSARRFTQPLAAL